MDLGKLMCSSSSQFGPSRIRTLKAAQEKTPLVSACTHLSLDQPTDSGSSHGSMARLLLQGSEPGILGVQRPPELGHAVEGRDQVHKVEAPHFVALQKLQDLLGTPASSRPNQDTQEEQHPANAMKSNIPFSW